mgnify:CR=1 FL=1
MALRFNPFTSNFDYVDSSGGSSTVSGGSYPAFILTDSSSVRWSVTVLTTGNLMTTATPSGPSGALSMHSIILKDPNGLLWEVTILPTGHLVTTPYSGYIPGIEKILLVDDDDITWIVSVSDAGNLITT